MRTITQQGIATMKGLIKSIGDFSTDITADATTLSTIARQALDAVTTDKKLIVELTAAIKELQDEIKLMNAAQLGASVGAGVFFFTGLLGVYVCALPGLQIAGGIMIAVGVIGTAASITGLVLATNSINTKNDSIQDRRKTISSVNQDVIALQAVNSQFQELDKANVEARDALRTISQLWTNLDDELTVVKDDLTKVDTDTTSAQYRQAKIDLKAAAAAWREVVDFATSLAGIDYRWQDKKGIWHSMTDEHPGADSAKVDSLPSDVAA